MSAGGKVGGKAGWIDRRTFLRASAAAGGGLLLAVYVPACGDGTSSTLALNLFIRIDPNGTVTLVVPRPDMGQGVRTSLPMLLAEELDVPWGGIRIEQADLDDRFNDFGGQDVGGSNSVAASWEPLRLAGATARWMLVSAAAARWGVDRMTCETAAGRVRHGPSGQSLGYGELVADAATRSLPDTPPRKDPGTYAVVGTARRHLDAAAIVRGQQGYGLDVRLPGMLRAAISRSPTFGARPLRYDAARALATPGVRAVLAIDPTTWPDFPPNSPKPSHGIAVVADSTWAAFAGRDALDVEWEAGNGATESTGAIWTHFRERASAPPDRILRDDGDVNDALRRAARRVAATYQVPFLAHASMEPMNATARIAEGRCEVWVPTQNPAGARAVAALVTGLPPDAVAVHPTRMGGAFGRRYYSDFVAEAAFLAARTAAPVQVVWSREDDIRHDLYRPAGYHQLEGGLDGTGRVTAWSHRLTNASRYAALGRQAPAGAGELYEFDYPAGFVPNYRLAYAAVASPVPRGQWRGIAYSSNVFATESFVDEMAIAAGQDPLAFRRRLLGPARPIPYFSATYDSGRLSGVLDRVAAAGRWMAPLADGRGRGIAVSYANGAFASHVVEVETDAALGVTVRRVTTAVDVGRVVNPNGARAQVEGSVLQGLSAALAEEITIDGGRVTQGNFDRYPVLRMPDAPAVEVHFVESDVAPSGVGEGALPGVAPALANAVFAATGVRVRRLPLRPSLAGGRRS